MRRAYLVRAAGLVALALAGPAAAAEPPGVELATAGCAPNTEAALRRIVRVEIRELLLEPGDPLPPERDRVLVACGSGFADIGATHSGGAQSRQVRLEELPSDAHPRVLALAALELLAAVSPRVRRRFDAGEPVRIARENTPPPHPSARLLLAGFHRRFLGDGGLATWGGGLKLERDLGARWGVGAALDVGGGKSAVALGEVSGLLASAGASLDLRARAGALAARAGLGARLGLARMAGAPAATADLRGRSVLRPWGGPLVAVELQWGSGPACVALGVEGGLALWGAEGLAAASTAAAASGPWIAITLGAGGQR